MQNIKIDVYISDLLYSYDCVVIPDFGGFVANYASAKVQAVQHKITPPSKKISFNKNLRTNDGLLNNYIAEKKSLTYAEASDLIKAFVNQSIDGLNKGDKIKIEKVGTLFLDPERNIQFIAEEQNDFLLESFGFGSLRVQAIKREGAKERIEKQIEKTIPLVQEEKRRKRKYYWPAAALLIFFLSSVFLLNQQFDWVDTTKVNYSAISFNNSEKSVYEARTSQLDVAEINLEESTPEFEEAIVPYSTSEGETTSLFVDNRKEEIKKDNTRVINEVSSKELRFHVMGGCFSNLSNAEKLVSKLQKNGYDARLLGKYKSLHAVSFGSFATREDAIKLLSEVKSTENPAAWLLVKPF